MALTHSMHAHKCDMGAVTETDTVTNGYKTWRLGLTAAVLF